ncbi:MAG: hypothetical protein ACKOEY_03360, partial [Phenylobacterium sp.]
MVFGFIPQDRSRVVIKMALACLLALALCMPRPALAASAQKKAFEALASSSERNAFEQPEASLSEARAALEIALTFPSPDERAAAEVKSRWLIARSLSRMNLIDEADREIAIAESLMGNSSLIEDKIASEVFYIHSSILIRKGKSREALYYLNKTNKLAKTNKDNNLISKSLILMASLYRMSGQIDKCIS